MHRFVAALACLLPAVLPTPGIAQAMPANEVPITAETPVSGFNRLTVSVTVCQPGTTRCATIDHVMVDTGSIGLRLQARAVPGFLRLPPVRDGSGQAVAQCLRFLNSAAWGGLHAADVRMGGLVAHDIPVQVVGTDLARHPACPDGGSPTSNGTLGIGPSPAECGNDGCGQSVTAPTYFACDDRTCRPMGPRVPVAFRPPNPVTRFGLHDNGVVFDLPMPARRGVPAVRGRLLFGVGTAADNALGDARVLRLQAPSHLTTRFNNADYPDSYIDSGTEYIAVPDPALPRCHPGGDAVCQEPTRRLGAEMVGADGARIEVPFLVGRFPRAGERGVFAAAAYAVPANSRAFVWGAPFFLGRRVFLVFRNAAVPDRPDLSGPFYAIARD